MRHRPPPALDFAGVIDLWPSEPEFRAALGVSESVVRAWRTRDSIPPERWDEVIAAAAQDGIPGVSLDTLMGALRIAMARAKERRSRHAAGVSLRRGTTAGDRRRTKP